jgi:hypothetical protein
MPSDDIRAGSWPHSEVEIAGIDHPDTLVVSATVQETPDGVAGEGPRV